MKKNLQVLDEAITDNNIKHYGLKVITIFFLISMIFTLPLNPLVDVTNNGAVIPEAFAEPAIPVKISKDRGSETWDLYGNSTLVFKAGGEATTNTWDSVNSAWKPYILTDLGAGDFKIQSGRIATEFLGQTITHYDSNMTNIAGTEKVMLMKKQGSDYNEVLETFDSRTLQITQDIVSETVSGILVSDIVNTVKIFDNSTTGSGNFLTEYKYIDSKPLKHTITFNSTTSGTFAVHLQFSMTLDKYVLPDGNEVNIPPISFTISKAQIETILTLINSDQPRIEFRENNALKLVEIIAPSTSDPAWAMFKELYIDTTNSPTILLEFRYGDWVLSAGQSFTLDPDTYSSNNPTEDGYMSDNSGDEVCSTFSAETSTTTEINLGMDQQQNGGECHRPYFEWDISSIPSGSTVTDSVFRFELYDPLGGGPPTCHIHAMANQPTTSSGATVFADSADGTQYVSFTCDTAGTNLSEDLGTSADSDIQTAIDASQTWFALGIHDSDDEGQATVTSEFDFIRVRPEEGVSPTPAPTLEITYNLPSDIIPRFFENDGSTVITTGEILQANSSTTRTVSVNSTGQAKFTGLGGNQNFTFKETTDNYVVNQTINYNAVAYDLWATPDASSFIFDIDCADSGSGTDLTLKVNDTDYHHITAFSTPVCSANNVVTSTITWTANGQNSNWGLSTLHISDLNTTHFDGTVNSFTVNSTSVNTSFTTPDITSSAWSVGSGLTTRSNIYLELALIYLPDPPTSNTATTISSSQIDLSWVAPTNAGNGTISGYEIQQDILCDGSFVTIVADTGNTQTTYSDINLVQNTCYDYQLRTINEVGTSNEVSNQNSATTLESGGGGGGGGAGSSTRDPESDEPLFETIFDITGGFKKLGIGETTQGTTRIEWDTASSIQINVIEVDTSELDSIRVTYQNIPIVLTGDDDGMSSGLIGYTVQVPPLVCGLDIASNCAELRLYNVPVALQIAHEGKLIRQSFILQVDLTGETELALFTIFGAVALAGFAIFSAVKFTGKNNNKNKRKNHASDKSRNKSKGKSRTHKKAHARRT